jgi:hypothetical protein
LSDAQPSGPEDPREPGAPGETVGAPLDGVPGETIAIPSPTYGLTGAAVPAEAPSVPLRPAAALPVPPLPPLPPVPSALVPSAPVLLAPVLSPPVADRPAVEGPAGVGARLRTAVLTAAASPVGVGMYLRGLGANWRRDRDTRSLDYLGSRSRTFPSATLVVPLVAAVLIPLVAILVFTHSSSKNMNTDLPGTVARGLSPTPEAGQDSGQPKPDSAAGGSGATPRATGATPQGSRSGGGASTPMGNGDQPTTAPLSQPSSQPSSVPSPGPSSKPSSQPSSKPSTKPSAKPSSKPSSKPSAKPTTKAPTSKPNPYTATGICGSGYRIIDSHGLGSATVYLLYRNGYNCVVTLLRKVDGNSHRMKASLEVQGGTRGIDSGQYTYYAGPIRRNAPSKCVIWGGQYGPYSWKSGWSHCG